MEEGKKMKKLCLVIACMLCLSLGGVLSTSAHAESEETVSDNVVKGTYDKGIKEGIINQEKVTYDSFLKMCREEVIPAYEQYKEVDSNTTFLEYCEADNYEQPYISEEDNPTTVTAVDHTTTTPNNGSVEVPTAAKTGYKMKAGDILVCYGSNSSGRFVGHAAIATSSKYILEMPGTKKYSKYENAHHPTKESFFKAHTGKNQYVAVYRIKNHPHYADDASTYAYKYMYKKSNPDYFISTRLYHKSPSYCSKYVYLSYYWGAKKSSVKYYKSHVHVVTPHGLVGNFKGSFKPSYIHKITKY